VQVCTDWAARGPDRVGLQEIIPKYSYETINYEKINIMQEKVAIMYSDVLPLRPPDAIAFPT